MRLPLVLSLMLGAFPSWGQVGRVALETPASPTITVGGGVSAELSSPAPSAGALRPGLGLSGVLPAASVDPDIKAVAGSDIVASKPSPLPSVSAAQSPLRVFSPDIVVKTAANANVPGLKVVAGGKALVPVVDPVSVGALFDGSLEKPDLDALTTVKLPAAPAAWTPKASLLKPFAGVWNALRASAHERRVANLPPEKRFTVEELGIRETLMEAWSAAVSGRPQEALDRLTKNFQGSAASGWYRANPKMYPYQDAAFAQIRWLEVRVKRAFERGLARSRETDLVAEALQAARDGSLLGHEWRRTAIQDKDSGHCAHHALFNAVTASVGFAYPLSVAAFVERARELLNVSATQATGMRARELAALERGLGLKFGRDVGEGMGTETIVKWASMLGMAVENRGPPHGDAGWSAVFSSGREALLSLRLFHESFPHSEDEKAMKGHDYRVLHHEVYLLGAFDSRSRGVRLYMVQDSGTGATEFFTAEELDALVSDVQYVSSPKKVAVP